MQRSSIIATVIAAGGVLVAGSVASVAVINAASTSQPPAQTIELVSADQPNAEPTETAAAAAAPAATSTENLPPVAPAELPPVPVVNDAPAAAPAAPAQGDDAAQPAVTAKPAAATPTRTPADAVSSGQARSVVLKQGDGVSVVSVSKASRGEYRTWAVRITRSNGEVLTGYVDRASGTVIDWVVNEKPATPKPTATSNSGADDDSYESEDDSYDDSDSDDESDDDSDDESDDESDSDDD